MAKKLRAPRPRQQRSDRIYLSKARIDNTPAKSTPIEKAKQLINGYIDPTKVFHKDIDAAVRKRINRMHEVFHLPASFTSRFVKSVSDVLVINHEGRKRELLPDIPPRHVMLCHRSMARVIESGLGMFAKISEDSDGCWALVPTSVDMLNRTTVQHLRRRPFWFLRRYAYELSFDGRVEPSMMLFDYGITPDKPQQRFTVTFERVPIRDQPGKFNQFFRFWLSKRNIKNNH